MTLAGFTHESDVFWWVAGGWLVHDGFSWANMILFYLPLTSLQKASLQHVLMARVRKQEREGKYSELLEASSGHLYTVTSAVFCWPKQVKSQFWGWRDRLHLGGRSCSLKAQGHLQGEVEKGGPEAGKSVAHHPCSLSHKPAKAWVPLASVASSAQHPCFLSSTCSLSLSVGPFGIFWGLCVPFLTLQAPDPISTHRQRTTTPTYFRIGPSVSASSLFLPSPAIKVFLRKCS